jgi:excisionase family DNA binding protein
MTKKMGLVERELLGVAEAEMKTGVSRWTWRRWAYDGRVSSVKMGSRLLIPAAEVERLVTENTRPRFQEIQS